MKKLMIGQGILVLLLVAFLGACGGDKEEDDPLPPLPSRVGAPTITKVPNRAFNNESIKITLSTTTDGASIYYTLNGTAPTATNGKLYAEPFDLTANDTIESAYRGRVRMQVIGIKDGHPNSPVSSQYFQIFPKAGPYKTTGGANYSGTVSGTATTGGFHTESTMTVGITLNEGEISTVSITNGGETEEYFQYARNHAQAFLPLMNHWDFDPAISGASYAGAMVRDAAQKALNTIPAP